MFILNYMYKINKSVFQYLDINIKLRFFIVLKQYS